jgi:hypothetical protein
VVARFPALAFLAAALLTLALGSAHLGRKRHGWRAVLNVRHSWLAREIAAFLLFTLLGTVWLADAPNRPAWGLAGAVCGLLLLVAIDRVYASATLPPRAARPHSAGALLTGLFFTAVFSFQPGAALLAGGVKLALYGRRRRAGAPDEGMGGGQGAAAVPAKWPPVAAPLWSALRVGLGFVLPAVAWATAGRGAWPLIAAGVLAGEWLDRAEFYAWLEVDSPQRELVLALRRRIAAAGDGDPQTPHLAIARRSS